MGGGEGGGEGGGGGGERDARGLGQLDRWRDQRRRGSFELSDGCYDRVRAMWTADLRDVELRRDIWRLVRELRDTGVTVILTTHYIDEAEEMADRIGVISRGELILVE